jgi:superfamily I DNA/RNA helicase
VTCYDAHQSLLSARELATARALTLVRWRDDLTVGQAALGRTCCRREAFAFFFGGGAVPGLEPTWRLSDFDNLSINHVQAIRALRRPGSRVIDAKRPVALFRASHHSVALEIELAVRSIPFVKFGGLKFLDSTHVKDVLACLRWSENPRDRVAGFRVLQILPGIGPAKAGQILDQTGSAGAVAALAELRSPGGAAAEWSAFADMMRRLSLGPAGWPAEVEAVRRRYEPHLERIHDDAQARKADLMQIEQIAAGYPSRERFRTELEHLRTTETADSSKASQDEVCGLKFYPVRSDRFHRIDPQNVQNRVRSAPTVEPFPVISSVVKW